jgi:hypothetical protein
MGHHAGHGGLDHAGRLCPLLGQAGHRGRPPAGPRSRCGGPAAAPDADPRSRRSGTLPGPQPQRLADAMATGHAQVVEGERATASWRRLDPRRAATSRRCPAWAGAHAATGPGSSWRAESVVSPGDGSWPSSLVNDCSATAGSRIVTPVSHRRRCPGLELDLRARTIIAAVPAAPGDSLLALKAGAAGVSGPGLAPPPGAAHHLAVTLAVNHRPIRRLSQLTGIVGPVGLALS